MWASAMSSATDRIGSSAEVVSTVRVITSVAQASSGEAPSARARSAADEAVAAAETVPRPVGGQPAGSVEEAERIAAWLEQPGVRFIETQGDWAWPLGIGLAEGELAAELLGQEPLPAG